MSAIEKPRLASEDDETQVELRLRRENSAGRSSGKLSLAPERVRTATEAAHSMPFPCRVRRARKISIVGQPDLRDTIARLQAFQEAGLFAPGLKTRAEIVAVVRSADRPVNVIMGLQGMPLNPDELSEMGVKRISMGSSREQR